MTAEQQRIAIARIHGYTKDKKIEQSFSDPSKDILIDTWLHPNGYPVRKLPDYLHDLNVMHEMEKVLTPEQLGIYAMWLVRLVETFSRLPSGWFPHSHYIWHATAAQRAEAFLRTLNLWKDSPNDNH